MFQSFLLLWILASSVQDSTMSTAQETASCGTKTCGNLIISDPFWLVQEQELERPCGLVDYQVYCYKNSPFLRSTIHDGFGIQNIFYRNHTFLAADINKMEDFNRCQVPITNTSVKIGFLPFNISHANRDLLFFYDCIGNPVVPQLRHGLVPMHCGNNSFVHLGRGPYIASHDYAEYFIEGCKTTLVPVLGASAKTADAGDYEQLIRDGFLLSWPVVPDQFPRQDGRHNIKLILIVSLSATVSLLTFLVWGVHRQKQKISLFILRKQTGNKSSMEEMLRRYGSLAPKRYKYSELKQMTSSFKDKLGEGGYGTVFRGSLQDGCVVAVKLLKVSKGNGEEFLNEAISIGRTSHINIVGLLGFCLEGAKRALVYEYMANGSLEKYIYIENSDLVIGWDKLQQIALGIARGLEYLHQGCSTRIIHFDIKPQNILLDQDFCSKIADFGLAKLCHLKDSILSVAEARGTIGFIAPEVFSRGFGVVSTKSDVYSYGMMLLEMVGGRINGEKVNIESSSDTYFPNWIYDNIAVHVQSCEVICDLEETMRKMALVGLWCIQTNPGNRPTMSKVIDMLEKSINELEMPPKPFLSCPSIPSH
ncbi:hypothetical protein CFC21_039416 [Triticum aestivum]|uniref:non-specific serine/threonine protein kinase n=3 Tax=Triticum aestivum TaxID=4565 RepID=A0A9R1JRU5_WHEAT|nr:hypothetical protein CFC21_039416 [Triticum aestivum]